MTAMKFSMHFFVCLSLGETVIVDEDDDVDEEDEDEEDEDEDDEDEDDEDEDDEDEDDEDEDDEKGEDEEENDDAPYIPPFRLGRTQIDGSTTSVCSGLPCACKKVFCKNTCSDGARKGPALATM